MPSDGKSSHCLGQGDQLTRKKGIWGTKNWDWQGKGQQIGEAVRLTSCEKEEHIYMYYLKISSINSMVTLGKQMVMSLKTCAPFNNFHVRYVLQCRS